MQFSVGSVEGLPFTACTSGPDIIILASNFTRVQQITVKSPISSLDCSTHVGKIAASYNNKMVIFQPKQVTPSSKVTKLDHRWVETATIESETPISVMSFNSDGTRLIAGGQNLQLWVLEPETDDTNWQCVWKCNTASNTTYLKFSPDGTLFCSAGKSDRLIKIWYEFIINRPTLSVSNNSNSEKNSANNSSFLKSRKYDFSYIYIAHPVTVTSIDWRSTSNANSTGTIANVLITSCKDNIARIWVQTSFAIKPGIHFHLAGVIETESLRQMCADLLFNLNKSDGSLTLWQVKHLDEEEKGLTRQIQIDKLSRLKSALPHHDATTMSLNVTAYSQGAESKEDDESITNTTDVETNIFIVTQHLSGILSLWKINFDSDYPNVQSVDLVTRITGLPIDPAWLRDGILIVEYLDEESSLITKWIPDENGERLVRKSSKHPFSPLAKFNPYNFDEIKSSLTCNLPSVDEEAASKPMQPKNSSQEESQTDIKDSYRASQMASDINILPQYHIKQLIELLAFGKLQRVKAILNHLVNCLLLLETHQEQETDPTNPAPWAHRSRTLSIVAQTPPAFHNSFDIDNPSTTIQQQVIEEIELDYIDVTSIKPLPLYSLLDADVEKPHSVDTKSITHEEFSTSYESIMRARSQVDETLDEILGQSTIETLNKQKELKRLASDVSGKGSLTSFNPKKAKLLTRVLTHTHLPGLSNVDQMHLLAVADAVALFDASPDDLNDIQDEDYDSSNANVGGMTTNFAIDSLDDRGLRFLTAMRQHIYLTRCLPMKQRNEIKSSGIGNHNLVWAFHSETQDELISLIPCVQRNKPEWAELREFGVGWWLKKLEVLRKLIEKVAQSAYQARQDPLDAALFYLAMKKKTLVCALLRRVNCDKRLLKLFEQDFNDPVNRKKALKNAYALLGLHRFEHAAAFFILAGSIWDAVEVCINNLNDIQLAIILIRLYDNDNNLNNLKKLLFTEILGSKRPTEQAQSQQQNNLKNSLDRKSSNTGTMQYNYDPKRAHQDPFLRSIAFWKLGDYLSAVHTLLESDVGLQRHRPSLVQLVTQNTNPGSRRSSDAFNSSQLSDTAGQLSPINRGNVSVSASVFNFYLFLKDQPLVVKHKQQLLEEMEIKKRTSPVEEEHVHCHRARSLSSGELGFDERGLSRVVKQSSTEFEVLNETTRLVDKYSDEATAEKERRLFFSTASSYLDAGCPLLALEVLCREDHLNMSKAQRMKFIACLHILMNELNTLSADQFYDWFEKSVDALKSICSYSGCPEPDIEDPNEPIIRAMLTYCNFHSENSLNVRSELLSLLKIDRDS